MKFVILAFLLCTSYLSADEIIIPLDFEEAVDNSCYQLDKIEQSVAHGFKINLLCEYPTFKATSPLIEQVHHIVREHVATLEKDYINEIVDRYDQGIFDEYFDGPNHHLEYRLLPTFYSDDLISLYGCCFRYYSAPHGSIRHEGRTFWMKGTVIRELDLDDLFIQDSTYTNFIIDYCVGILKATGTGYYTPDHPVIPEIKPFDIRTFVLSEKGLVVIFQPFVVETWTEGPSYVVIPYADLTPFIQPEGPLGRFSKSPITLK
jgi:hypothetical protein